MSAWVTFPPMTRGTRNITVGPISLGPDLEVAMERKLALQGQKELKERDKERDSCFSFGRLGLVTRKLGHTARSHYLGSTGH